MTSTPPDSAQTQTLSPAFGLAVLHSRFAPFAEAEKDDGPLFVAPVNLVIHQDDCAFVRATLELGKPTRLPCVVDFIWVLLQPDDAEAAALYRDFPPGARSLPWYAAADAGIVGWGEGPHDVPEGRPSPNVLTAAVSEAKDPSISRRGLGDEDARFIAAALSAAAIADPRKRPIFDLAAAEFGWAEAAAETGTKTETETAEEREREGGSLFRAREWLSGLFDTGSPLTAEHVRIMAAHVNPFVPISGTDDLWVCAGATLWSGAPPAARRLLCALDSAAARRFCVRVRED